MARTTTRKTTTATKSTRTSKATAKTTTTKARSATAKTTKTTAKAKTATRAKSAAKGVTAPKAAPKAAPKTTATRTTKPVAAPKAEVARELKKKELIDRVVAASGVKKNQAKPVVESMLAILGDALAKGEAMNLEPMGKVKVQKEKDVGGANVYSCRIRRKKIAGAGTVSVASKAPLAKAAQ